MTGIVTIWDDAAGLGEVTADDGRVYPLHCTQLTDQTRTVEVGRAVRFELRPRLGRWEASAVDKL